MHNVSAYFLTTDKPIVTKLHQTIEEIKLSKIYNLGSKGTWTGSRDLLLNFGTPSISRERLKLETSNLASRLALAVLSEKMQN